MNCDDGSVVGPNRVVDIGPSSPAVVGGAEGGVVPAGVVASGAVAGGVDELGLSLAGLSISSNKKSK